MNDLFPLLAADTSFAPAASRMNDDDFWAITIIGVILTLWLVGGLVAVGRPKTYRLGMWMLGSGLVAGFIAGLAWVG
jgi:hypothetical protein